MWSKGVTFPRSQGAGVYHLAAGVRTTLEGIMDFTEFVRRQLSESDGQPSNNRVMLFLFLTTVMALVLGVVFAPLFKRSLSLPTIPPSFETFVEIIVGTLVTGTLGGKVVNAVKDVKGAANAGTTEEQAK